MTHPSTGRRLLLKLVQEFGAEGAAARLSITSTLLSRFLAGSIQVPDPLLVRAIDVLPNRAPSLLVR
ncbi:MAG TPA: hypothetical protein VJV79_12280 [Polyangiaceae bacterium]|nr:hypothetical protein [Polyangiaceae bacterium]